MPDPTLAPLSKSDEEPLPQNEDGVAVTVPVAGVPEQAIAGFTETVVVLDAEQP
jgi:hypothetical protein